MKYYGEQTTQAIANFPFSYHRVDKVLIYAIVAIKKAAAIANERDGRISKDISSGIVSACEMILDGKYDDQFVTCALQGGAGTSINMNVNEVIASIASEVANITIHPLDHVNASQSTNDVNPSALKIVMIRLLRSLVSSMDQLVEAFLRKANTWKTVGKLGRTHLQDAVPTTLSAEFSAYASICEKHRDRLKDMIQIFYRLNLGGTAIGNGINASERYRQAVYEALREHLQIPVIPAENLMAETSSQGDFLASINALVAYLADLSKIANDIRLMASGPRGGLAELRIPELQKGSTIMPGKVNPIIPEAINQLYFLVAGKALTVQLAATSAQLELANMFPILADSCIHSFRLAIEGTTVFRFLCIDSLEANENMCKRHLNHSTAVAVLFIPKFGYETISKIVKECVDTERSFRDVIIEKGTVSEDEYDQIVHQAIV